jgi:hypothetical protein
MIESVSSTTPPVEALPSSGSARTLCHTPFGDVFVDEMSTPNLAGLCTANQPSVRPQSASPETVAVAVPEKLAAAVTVASGLPTSVVNVDPNAGPTAESLFGPDPFVKDPGGHGPNGTSWHYNPAYFATRHTADIIAKMIGGTVVERNAICTSGPMIQDQVNEMIICADGHEINAGLVADIFNHGRCQSVVDLMFKQETGSANDPRIV